MSSSDHGSHLGADLYKILELSPQCSTKDISQAYKRLALTFHPDKNKSDKASSMFIEINRAYKILSNASSKKAYDKLHNRLQNRTKINDDLAKRRNILRENLKAREKEFRHAKAQETSSFMRSSRSAPKYQDLDKEKSFFSEPNEACPPASLPKCFDEIKDFYEHEERVLKKLKLQP